MCSVVRFSGSYGGCADIGKGMISDPSMPLGSGDPSISFVVHFLHNRQLLDRCQSFKRYTHFFRLLSETMHSTSSRRQLVQGAPCSTTLHRTLRDRQHWHALEALRFTLFAGLIPGFKPAASAVRFAAGGWTASIASGEADESDIVGSAGSDSIAVFLRELTMKHVQCQRGPQAPE